MAKPQIIHTAGEDLIVISRSDYETLLARAGDEAAEDAATARIVDATSAKMARREDGTVPTSVWEAIEGGENPVRAIRKWRGLTQNEQAGLAQGFVANMESGKKIGCAASLKAIAAAFGVPLNLLVR